MSDYTPSTDEVRVNYIGTHPSLATSPHQVERPGEFDRWLESVRAEERERIARNMDAEQRRARAAHQSAPTDHFAHDYCRWVGHAEAFGTAARIAREGA